MTDLSPAAQAVLDAAEDAYDYNYSEFHRCADRVAAAALRAAADQVVPEYREHHSATLDERHRKVSAFDVRNRFLAIADELKNC
jgi:hypothetical protein